MSRLQARLPSRLPALGRCGAAVHLAVWLALLAVLVVGTVGAVRDRMQKGASYGYTWAPLGLAVDLVPGQPARVIRVTGAEATAAGFRSGQRIVSVNGVGTRTILDDSAMTAAINRQLAVGEGAAVRLGVEIPGGVRQVELHHHSADADAVFAPAGLTPQTLTVASTAAFLLNPLILLAGSALLLRRRREPVAAVLSLALLALATVDGNQGVYWSQLGLEGLMTAASTVGFFGLYLVILTFPDGRFRPRWTVLLAIAFALALTPLPYAAALTVVLLALFAAAVITIIARYRRESVDDRRQWKWAMVGFVAGTCFLVSTILAFRFVLPEDVDDIRVIAWSWIASPVILATGYLMIVGGVVLSVLRYRLYDAPAAVSRSLVYSSLTLALVGVFAGAEKVIEIAGEEYFGEAMRSLAGGLAAAFAATTIVPLHHRISHAVDHLLRREQLHLQRDFPPLLLEIGAADGAAAVAEALVEHLVHGLHASRAVVMLEERMLAAHGVDRFDAASAEALFPLRVALTRQRTGWLLLGPRPDGSLYGKAERALVAEIAVAAAQALAAGRRNDEVRIRLDAIERGLVRPVSRKAQS